MVLRHATQRVQKESGGFVLERAGWNREQEAASVAAAAVRTAAKLSPISSLMGPNLIRGHTHITSGSYWARKGVQKDTKEIKEVDL